MSRANALDAQASVHVKTMGKELGPLFHALEGQYVVARTQWEDVRTLFGHSQERIDLLFNASMLFFANWYEVFWNHALLQISALTCSATAKNVSVRRLPGMRPAKSS